MSEDRMYVATETFEAFLGGELEAFEADRSHVRSGHLILDRYPERFRLASRRTLAMRALERQVGGEYRVTR